MTPSTEIRNRIDQIRRDFESAASVGALADNLIAQFVADYSDKFSFILELIQNAVDSAQDGHRVEIRFDLREEPEGWILVASNNGLPFDVRDVERLCGMNKQRKGADRIGYKGLGFKTVTGVTDNPRIFSRECRFEFNRGWHQEHENLWVVIPHWIDQGNIPEYLPPAEKWVSFVLPLRADVDVEELSQAIDGLANHNGMASLLFLRDLESLSVTNARSETAVTLQKVIDPAEPLICKLVQTPFQARREAGKVLGAWIVTHFPSQWKFGDPLAITDAAIEEYKRKRDSAPNCTAVTLSSRPLISLAFRIETDGSGSVIFKPKKGRVSAFFPVHRDDNSGLLFSVHADFLTTQNRERLLPDSAWNRWILSNLHRAIASAVQEFKNRPEWFQFIYDAMPMEDEGRGEFNAVTKKLCQLLRLAEIVLVDGNAAKQWYSPQWVVWPDSEELRELIERADGTMFTQGKFLVSGAIKNDQQNRERPRNFLCGKAGMRVESLNRKRFLDLMTEEAAITHMAQDIDWLERLFVYLAEGSGITNAWIRRMAGIHFLPTGAAGKLARMGEVFLETPAAPAPAATIVINERLARHHEIRQFLVKRLQVPEGPEAFVQSIISKAPRPSWDEVRVLKRYFTEVGESRALKDAILKKLRNWIRLQGADGSFLSPGQLHLPADMNSGTEQTRGVPVFVPEDGERESWLRFFAWLGVREFSELVADIPKIAETGGFAQNPEASNSADVLQVVPDAEPKIPNSDPGIPLNDAASSDNAPPAPNAPIDTRTPSPDLLGRAGEQVAFDYVRDQLVERYSALSPVVEQVDRGHFRISSGERRLAEGVWGNGTDEHDRWQADWGEHYDFWVRIDDQDHYYEVKTTDSSADVTEGNAGDQFRLTHAESAFAQEKGSCYHIARVYNVHAVRDEHEPHPNVVLVDDPSSMLARSTLQFVLKGSLEGAYTVRVKLVGMRSNRGEDRGTSGDERE